MPAEKDEPAVMDQDTYFTANKDAGDPLSLKKMEIDYAPQCDEKIPAAEHLAQTGKLAEGLELLYGLERLTRLGADTHSTTRLLLAIVKMCYQAGDWNALCENISLICKKRGQVRQSVTKMVQEACTYVEKTKTKEMKLKYLEILRTVTDGKIYVENERARLTKTLAEIKEADGDIQEAAKLMQNLHVETYGSMERREKVEFLLEQMRLCLACADFTTTMMVSRKISIKYFEEEDTSDLKLRYYTLMISLDAHESRWLAVCQHYMAVWKTTAVGEEKARDALSCAVLFLLLAPLDSESSSLLHKLKIEKTLSPEQRELLTWFTTHEIFHFSVVMSNYGEALKLTSVFKEDSDKRWALLKRRISEHNVRVLSKYYTRLRLPRMATLLQLSEAEAEQFLSDLVTSGQVHAKLDRLEGLVTFTRAETADDMLNTWSYNLSELMTLVARTTHLIEKEHMVHKLKAAQVAK